MRCVAAITLVLVAPLLSASSEWKVRVDGVGPLKIGMSAAELQSALGQIVAPVDEEESDCFYVVDANRKGLSYMITLRGLARVDVDGPGIETVRGAAVGVSVERIRLLYGTALEEQPHFYGGAPNLYLTYWSRDRRYAVRFETADGKVARYYAGGTPEVEFVEGCL